MSHLWRWIVRTWDRVRPWLYHDSAPEKRFRDAKPRLVTRDENGDQDRWEGEGGA